RFSRDWGSDVCSSDLGAGIMGAGRAMRQAIVPARMARLAEDAAVMPALGEDESQVVVGKKLGLVDGFPRGNVIGLGGDDEHRRQIGRASCRERGEMCR